MAHQTAAAVILASLSSAVGSSACAQAVNRTPTLAVEQVLEPIEQGRSSSGASVVLLQRGKYPARQIESLVVALDRLVTTAPTAIARVSAAQALASAAAGVGPVPGVFDRLIFAYRRTDESLVRRIVVTQMQNQHDRVRAIAFLKEIASKPTARQDFDGAARTAVETLSFMGDDGRTALYELHSRGAIADAAASAYANWFLSKK